MQKRDICREAARRIGMPNGLKAEKLFDECVQVMAEALMEGELVHLNPFGVLAARYDKRPHIRGRVLKLLVAPSFNRKLRGVQTEYPEWYRKLSGD